ncbi:unnamed protein product [Camellia sinensis]
MAGRRQIPSTFEGRSVQAPGMMRHGPFPGLGPAGHHPMESLPPAEHLENKMAVQVAEMERLAGENHRLAATQVAMRQDLAVAQQEIQRVRAHIRSIQTEADIQIRVLLDKIAKMEVDIRDGESVKKDLHLAHMEAQSLVTARQDLTVQIQQATKELDKAHADLKKLPEMHGELDSLRQEHQRLRQCTTFEYEKGLNMEKVEQMQAMEKNMMGMAREVEKLRAEVLNAEKRARAPNPYGGPYMHPDPIYPPPVHGGGAYVDSYGRPHGHMGVGVAGEGMIPYAAGPGDAGRAPVPTAGGPSAWGGVYDAPHPRR